jgi:carbon storage regulator
MLKLSRRIGESLLIGDQIEIEIIDIRRGQVRIGIRAPREITILRREIAVTMHENTIAAGAVPDDVIARVIETIVPA